MRLERGERRAWTGGSEGGWRVNGVGVWEASWEEPLWVMGNLPVEELLGVYRERMKIEESFRDLKSYLGMGNLMNKRRENAEKTLWLLAFAYALGLLLGETLRGRWQRERGGPVGGSGGTTPGSSFS
ncbi:transposase [Thermus sp. LT1-2-5]|uniref:transposase n=1 Tax=Thermus sp. LT1-2-5 TaxID=3026935 RepID=UPI00336594A8